MDDNGWTTIRAENESNEKVKEIINISGCPFYGAHMIDVYEAAAALAVKNKIVPVKEYGRESDVTHVKLITDEMKSFMCMLYYSVDPDKDLNKLKDKTAVVKNFEQYAQAGLELLYSMCTEKNSIETFKFSIAEIARDNDENNVSAA